MSDRVVLTGRFLVSSAAAALALLAGCSSLVGEQSGGRYTAPDELFSLPVPGLSMGAAVEDQAGTHPETKLPIGSVSFHDDFGSVRSIQYEQVTPDVARSFSEPARALEILRGYARDRLLAGIQQHSPRARIVHEGPATLADGVPAWFAVLEIPEGSTLVGTSAENPDGRRLDSTRGFLLLCRAGLFLTLSAADDFGQVLALVGKPAAEAGAARPATMDALRDKLVQLYSGMSFR